MKNILITGVVGMIGSILLTKLLSRKDFFNINFSKKIQNKEFLISINKITNSIFKDFF